jgi:hypothetical protein
MFLPEKFMYELRAIFGDDTVFEKTTFCSTLLHHTCHLEFRSKKLTFFSRETVNQLKPDQRHRDDLLWLKRCLKILNYPGLTVAFCKFLVFNIVKISLKLGDSCDHIFARGYNELGGRYMIENITQAGCVKGRIDIRKTRGSHRDFLRVYNQTHDLEAKSQINTLVTSFASNGLLIIIFLVLCSQEILNIM